MCRYNLRLLWLPSIVVDWCCQGAVRANCCGLNRLTDHEILETPISDCSLAEGKTVFSVMSAIPSDADMCTVRFVPKADITSLIRSPRPRGRLQALHIGVGVHGIGGVHKYGKTFGCGDQFMQ